MKTLHEIQIELDQKRICLEEQAKHESTLVKLSVVGLFIISIIFKIYA